jgi:hypothetical protein
VERKTVVVHTKRTSTPPTPAGILEVIALWLERSAHARGHTAKFLKSRDLVAEEGRAHRQPPARLATKPGRPLL